MLGQRGRSIIRHYFDERGCDVTRNICSRVFWAAVLVVVLVGCDRAEGPSEKQQVEESGGQEYYSPFVVTGEGDLSFEEVTFTDVGLSAPDTGPVDRIVLEAIAESVAYELAAHDGLEFDAQVRFDEALIDPENHLYCDSDHIYVALWRGYDPERWGYSLWSGCHEGQQFEWKEIDDPFSEDVDPVTWVEPLAESIVESIDEAHADDCFVAEC